MKLNSQCIERTIFDTVSSLAALLLELWFLILQHGVVVCADIVYGV